MFTGLIETVGEVAEVKPTAAGVRLRLTTTLSPELSPGDSVAVNGVCLTVVSADASGVHMDVSPETLRVSALGSLKRGVAVNMERPMRADSRVGGHFVQGHVDATGTIEEIRKDGDCLWVTVKFPPSLAAQIVRKGSIKSLNELEGKRVAVFQPEFREDLRFWVKTERSTAIRVLDLVEAVMRDPFQGLGKPEPLKYVLAGCWSRRVNQEHRLVYRIADDAIDFLQARYHY